MYTDNMNGTVVGYEGICKLVVRFQAADRLHKSPRVEIRRMHKLLDTWHPSDELHMYLSVNEDENLPFDEAMAELFRRDKNRNTVSYLETDKFGRVDMKANLTYDKKADTIIFDGEAYGSPVNQMVVPAIDMVNALYGAYAYR